MPIAESDLELLETYLDGELPIADAEGLWRRLSNEPVLSATLDTLRAERAMRLAVWSGMEPAEAQEIAVARRVTSIIRRRNHWESVARVSKFSSAAAAMILVGFVVGRMRGIAPAISSPASSNNQFVLDNTSSSPAAAGNNLYRVGYYDPNGKLIAVQPFNSLQDANEFVNDVNSWQIQNHATPDAHDSSIVPVSDNQWR
jgi:anti-sigma factor RsiW